MVAIRYSRCPVKFLIWILIALLNSVVSSVAASINHSLANVTVYPPYLDQLTENTNRTVWIRVSFPRHHLDGKYGFESKGNTSHIPNIFGPSPPPSTPRNITFEFKIENPLVARVVHMQNDVNPKRKETFDRALAGMDDGNSSLDSGDGDDDDEDEHWFVNASFTVEGIFLGKTKIEIKIVPLVTKESAPISPEKEDELGNPVVEYVYDVWVVRHEKKLTHIFVGTLLILLVVANVLMGSQLNLNVVYEVIKKPLAPAVGFTCQFILMPLISYTLARLIFVQVGLYNLALGLFTTGCCPGGGASNAYTVLLDGNVDLSVTMTFLSTLLSLAVMPVWMFALSRQFLVTHPGHTISIPYKNIFYSLLSLVLPLCGGIALRRYFPKAADYAKKGLRPFLGIIIVFICTFGVYVNLYMFRLMTWRVLVGGMALPWMGFLFGLAAALLTRQPKPNIVAIAIETGIQNTGIGIMLLQLSFTQPDADLASVLPVVVAMFTPVPMVMAIIGHYILKWRMEKEKKLAMNGFAGDPLEAECFA